MTAVFARRLDMDCIDALRRALARLAERGDRGLVIEAVIKGESLVELAPGVAIEARRDAVHIADEGAGSAANHPQTNAPSAVLRHVCSP